MLIQDEAASAARSHHFSGIDPWVYGVFMPPIRLPLCQPLACRIFTFYLIVNRARVIDLAKAFT